MNRIKFVVCCLLVVFGLCALPVMAAQQTTVIYVNGIMTAQSDVVNQTDTFRRLWSAYASSHNLSQPVTFDFSYNTHESFVKDMGQSIASAAGVSWANLANDTKLQLLVLWVYSQEMMDNRIKLPVNPDDDLKKLVAKVKCVLNNGKLSSDGLTCVGTGKWSGNKVVILGHSQGNFYVNYAYELLKKDAIFQSQLGVSIPNDNVLSIVSLANPANYSADGRYKYLTVCNDPINLVPKALKQNEKTGPAAEVFCSPVGIILGDLIKAVVLYSGYVASIPRSSVVDQAALKAQTDQVLAEINNLIVGPHLLGNYLSANSTQLQTVMQLLADSLPDPGCAGDLNCYLKDTFSSAAGPDPNWIRVEDTKYFGNKVTQQGGVMTIAAGWVSPSPTPVLAEKLSLRTHRVFTGASFIATSDFRTSGIGVTEIRLKKAEDRTTAMSIKFDFANNKVSVFPNQMSLIVSPSSYAQFKKVTITKSNTQVTLSIDNVSTWASSSLMDGYYLEFYVESKPGFAQSQVIELQNFLASMTGSSVKPQPVVSPPTNLQTFIAAVMSRPARSSF